MCTAAAAMAQPNAADKDGVAGTAASLTALSPADFTVTLLSEEVKTSNTADLKISFVAECAIGLADESVTFDTDLFTDPAFTSLLARLEVWAESDGEPVPVAADDTFNPSRVDLCDRTWVASRFQDIFGRFFFDLGLFIRVEPSRVVAVPFPYIERPVLKRRPALIVSSLALVERHGLLWVVMITSAANPRWPDDIPIDDLQGANLRKPSVVRPVKLATVEATAAEVIGRVSDGVADRVRAVLGSYLPAPGVRPAPR